MNTIRFPVDAAMVRDRDENGIRETVTRYYWRLVKLLKDGGLA